MNPETPVGVRRQWNSTWTATYRLADVSDFHWSQISGGVQQKANRSYVHAYVMCDAEIEGELAHSCRHGEGPHRIKVCLVGVDNTKEVMQFVKVQASARAERNRAAGER